MTLGRIGHIRAIQPLANALSDSDFTVRASAAAALGRIGDSHAVPSLILALRDIHSTVRFRAIYALANIGDSRAVKPLMPLLLDPVYDVGIAAASAIGRMGDTKVADELIEIIDAASPEDRSTYPWLQTLTLIGDMRAFPLLVAELKESVYRYNQPDMAIGLAKLGDARAVPVLLDKAHKAKNIVLIPAVIEALGKLANIPSVNEEIVDALVSILLSEAPEYSKSHKMAAAEALGKIRKELSLEEQIRGLDNRPTKNIQLVDGLIKALQDADKDVRFMAIIALSRIKNRMKDSYSDCERGDPEVIRQELTAMLKDPEIEVRHAALDVLEDF